MFTNMITNRSRTCSRKCLRNGHIKCAAAVARNHLQRFLGPCSIHRRFKGGTIVPHVKLKNGWPSKLTREPKRNRRETSRNLLIWYPGGVAGIQGLSGVAVWEPRTWRQSQTRKRIWKTCFFVLCFSVFFETLA